MDKGVLSLIIAGCLGGGAVAGGFDSFAKEMRYDAALSSPEFYHLVDDVGNPVRELSNKPLR